MKTPMCASENQTCRTQHGDLRRDSLIIEEQFPLPHTDDETQRFVRQRTLEMIKAAGKTNDHHALVLRKQSDQRDLVRQDQVAETLAVAWKFKGHLVEGHAAQIRPASRRNDGMRIEWQTLGQ